MTDFTAWQCNVEKRLDALDKGAAIFEDANEVIVIMQNEQEERIANLEEKVQDMAMDQHARIGALEHWRVMHEEQTNPLYSEPTVSEPDSGKVMDTDLSPETREFVDLCEKAHSLGYKLVDWNKEAIRGDVGREVLQDEPEHCPGCGEINSHDPDCVMQPTRNDANPVSAFLSPDIPTLRERLESNFNDRRPTWQIQGEAKDALDTMQEKLDAQEAEIARLGRQLDFMRET